MKRFIFFATLFGLSSLYYQSAFSIEVVVDYSHDTRGFFNDPIRRTAMEAVASRFSRVITSELLAVEPTLDLGLPTPWRIGFEHPGTGASYQISTAANYQSDPIVLAGGQRADAYGFSGLGANEWILYVGGRELVSAGSGGTATGVNFTTIFDALDGPLHRGVISNTNANTSADLPAWGGAVVFNEDELWHFDLDSAAPNNYVDFYSIAMHEVAHVLGVGTSWNQWRQHQTGNTFTGPASLEALNEDNGTSYTSISLENGDPHWKDNTYQSKIFALGNPIEVATVGDRLQDLLLEPLANFSPNQRRLELTNVDAAALVDLGWSILSLDLDLNGDGDVSGDDVDLACTAGSSLEPYFAELNSGLADIDFSGDVGFSDFLVFSANFGRQNATYSMGDINCNYSVGFDDFLLLSNEFGQTFAASSVPEPTSKAFVVLGILSLASLRNCCRQRQ